MHKTNKITTLLLLNLILTPFVFTDSLTLKNGETIEGSIIEEADRYVRIDFAGTPLTYYKEQIEAVGGEGIKPSPEYIPLEKAEELFKIGVNYAIAEEFKKAEEEFRKVLAIQRLKYSDKIIFKEYVDLLKNSSSEKLAKDYVINFFKGEKEFSNNQPQKAIEYYQKAIQINPDYTSTYIALGSAYQLLNQPQKAIEYYQKALQIDPNLALAYSNLGDVYAFVNQPQKAIEYYQQAIQIESNFTSAYIGLGLSYFSINQPQKAIKYYQKTLQIDPNEKKAYLGLGVTYHFLKRPKESIKEYQNALEIDPNYILANLGIGRTYLDFNQPQKAIKYYQKTLQIYPNSRDAYFGLGIAYYRLNQPQKAKENLLKAKELSLQAGDYKAVDQIEKKLQQIQE